MLLLKVLSSFNDFEGFFQGLKWIKSSVTEDTVNWLTNGDANIISPTHGFGK